MTVATAVDAFDNMTLAPTLFPVLGLKQWQTLQLFSIDTCFDNPMHSADDEDVRKQQNIMLIDGGVGEGEGSGPTLTMIDANS